MIQFSLKKTILPFPSRRIFILFLCTLIFSIGLTAYGQDCNNLPTTFASYDQAVSLVKASTFKTKESVDTSKSSWIRGVTFYSCDGVKGFLILKTDSREYIHQNVPIEVWRGLKNADSFGNYYNNYIRGKYILMLQG
jgi:hypothetical protein